MGLWAFREFVSSASGGRRDVALSDDRAASGGAGGLSWCVKDVEAACILYESKVCHAKCIKCAYPFIVHPIVPLLAALLSVLGCPRPHLPPQTPRRHCSPQPRRPWLAPHPFASAVILASPAEDKH